MSTLTIYANHGEANAAAVEKYGQDYLMYGVVNVIKVGPTMAKHLGVEPGFALDIEMEII